MMYGPPAEKKRSGVLSKLLASVVTTLLILSLLTNLYLGLIVKSFTGGPSEAPYESGDGAKRVTILPVVGVINADTAKYVHDALKAIDDNPPDAVVLRVESGGGGVTASDEIHNDLEKYRKRHPRVKFVASFGNAAASGGYYIATPADYIVAETTCITGSLGVLAEVPTFQGTLKKLGVEVEVISADKSPRKTVANDMTRDWNDQDRAAVKRLVNAAYQRFVDVVWQGRKSRFHSRAQVQAIANGRVYTAKEAKKAKLIDQIGYLDDAIAKANAMVGGDPHKTPTVTILRRSGGFGLRRLLGLAHHALTTGEAESLPIDAGRIRSLLDQLRQPRLTYRADFR